jgi:signal transduction histidine kinase/CheY-like chemotaxis protein
LGRYTVAAALVVAAGGLEALLWPITKPTLSPLFFAAVILSAIQGGLGPALLATVLGAAASAFFFLPPATSPEIGLDDATRVAVFAAIAVVVSSVSAARRRAQAALQAAKLEAERANAAKDRFLAVLSHELRAPLSPVLLTASAMAGDDALPEQARADAALIRRNVQLETRLIDDLLDVTRIRTGKLVMRRERVDARVPLRGCLAMCQPEADAKGVRLVLEDATTRPELVADPVRLHQAFGNLVRNAVKFTPAGGTVTVRVRNEEGPEVRVQGSGQNRVPGASSSPNPQPRTLIPTGLVVEVTDTGIGMAPGALARVFEPFEQGDQTVTQRFGGLGLGLSIAKAIVEAHGGTIAASSPGPGRGTTMRVELPGASALTAVAEAPETNPPSETSRPAGLHILLVEDHADSARAMARLLRGEGHRVTVAGSLAEALAAANGDNSFDLLISDISLPDGTGLDLMRHLTTSENHIKAIALTGYGMEDDVRQSREAGFAVHLTTPVELDALLRAIDQVSHDDAPTAAAAAPPPAPAGDPAVG